MRAYRVEKTLVEDGVLELRALPFRAGEIVEVIILSREDKVCETQDFHQRGKVLRYEKPTDPVAQDDWEVLP
jgi:predicted DNA-binding antitoxin AbrB/MazE fold protein